ncbi:Rgi1p NDAI_0E04840 [Naumovozyma dairenensis CBS 421]|uniref:Respiratory growth induced protein 1 n=1 Tax=Naumovozyma dairenensis (strain ATCC 10597 / BCRC 20456 / CBS 421 / NBRC 0211 / NRRL Y-12639) TaxID=1071378 RepID=G0WAM8_NAUDC|nr:hypothetical protein NDAI_0E04840 [Naumovozyma dairenensis CBS 421]CCD25301.1 hypothetical protein NDAI_0E04840 [Naumovozyma dairenensis CBS 421]
MGKKDKGPKMTTVTTKDGEQVKVFEELDDFERYLKSEFEDTTRFDNMHLKLNYYPPFVMHHSHDDPDKIKDTDNSHNKKFVRHLHQHVEKHLLKDIKEAVNHPDLKWHDKSKDESFEKIVWHYAEDTEYNKKPFKMEVNVACNHLDAMVEVDYRTVPITPA